MFFYSGMLLNLISILFQNSSILYSKTTWGKPVPEYQTILASTAATDDGGAVAPSGTQDMHQIIISIQLYSVLTDQMSLLSPNQQCQSTGKGNYTN